MMVGTVPQSQIKYNQSSRSTVIDNSSQRVAVVVKWRMDLNYDLLIYVCHTSERRVAEVHHTVVFIPIEL
jgi:hypothetical protein